MARRRRTRKRDSTARRQALAVSIAAVAVLLGIALLPSARDGALFRALGAAERWVAGAAAPGIPALVFVLGIAVWALGGPPRPGRRSLGVLLVSLAATVWAQAGPPSDGGALGRALAGALEDVVGRWGAWTVTLAAAFLGVALVARVPAAAVLSVLSRLTRLGRLAAVLAWRALLAAGRVLHALFRGLGAVARDLGRIVSAALGALVGAADHRARRWRDARAARHETAAPASQEPPRAEPEPQPFLVPAREPEDEPAREVAAEPPASPQVRQPELRRRQRRTAEVRQEALPLEEPPPVYQVPPLSLLADPSQLRRGGKVDPVEVARALERTLASFAVEAKVIRWEQGPVVTRYELQPAAGVKVQRITSLQNDIALALAAQTVRIEAPIPGRSAVGIELPNEKAALVSLREILESEKWQTSPSPLAVGLGKDIAGQPVVIDLIEMPHLLIAGATGSGKSVSINAIIASLLFRATPNDARLILLDPKRVELTGYNGIPHLLTPVVTTPKEASVKLRWAVGVMERRFELFSHAGARNIQAYNRLEPERRAQAVARTIEANADRGLALEPRDFVTGGHAASNPISYLIIIIDELADLMMVAPADFEEVICRLAQMTRATGIHLVVATQRPSVDVITGLIKANIPSRIAFAVTSQVDSRTILDGPGADKLLGKGDMLLLAIGASRPTRVQGSFVADSEIERLVTYWRAQGSPSYSPGLLAAERHAAEGEADELLEQAARLIVAAGYGSVSLLQRKMKIGYVRAARVVDQLEQRGIVGPSQGSSPREVLVGLEDLDRLFARGRSPVRVGEPGGEPE